MLIVIDFSDFLDGDDSSEVTTKVHYHVTHHTDLKAVTYSAVSVIIALVQVDCKPVFLVYKRENGVVYLANDVIVH